MTLSYLIAIPLAFIFLCIMFFIVYKKISNKAEIAQARGDHFKSVSEYLERINRAVNSMDGIEAKNIRDTIPDAVRQTVFSGLNEKTIALYNILADGGINPFRADNAKKN